MLVTGESGTAKEVTARALHEQSAFADRPFVPVNCGAIAADKEVRYEAVLKVMDELQRANIRRVGLAVKAAGS